MIDKRFYLNGSYEKNGELHEPFIYIQTNYHKDWRSGIIEAKKESRKELNTMKKIIVVAIAAYVAVSAGMSVAVSNGHYEVLDYKGPFTVVEISRATVKGFTGAVEGNPDGRGIMWGEDERGCYRAFHDFYSVGSEVTSMFVYGFDGDDDIVFRTDF